MFRTLTLTGVRGSIVWGAGEAAALARWRVARSEDHGWTLSARVDRVDQFRLRQIPLLFQAPRFAKPAGLWCFPVLPNTLQVEGEALTAKLGPPEGR